MANLYKKRGDILYIIKKSKLNKIFERNGIDGINIIF